MKQFENKVLFIKDETMLKEVERLILDSKNKINEGRFYLDGEFDYLFYDEGEDNFLLSMKTYIDQEINLEQFKELLKQK